MPAEPRTKPKAIPAWAREKLVSCHGGPFAGQWFTEDDWKHRLRATRRMQEKHPARDAPTLDYVRTNRTETHPIQNAIADVWTYRK